MCQHFENTHRRYSPSISGKRKEHQRYFCQVGWRFYYPCPSPADAPPPYVLGQPSLTLYIAHFPDISHLCPPVTHILLRAVSHSANRFGIPFLKKLLNSAKMHPHKRKFSIKISSKYISQELQSLPNRAMIGKTILVRYAAGQPLPAHRMVNSNRLTPGKERVCL